MISESHDGELCEDERNEFDPPTPLAPMPKGPSKRKPRERYFDSATGERIAKRDLRAVQRAGVYGPKIGEYPVCTVAEGCPLDTQTQRAIYHELRLGTLEQSAVEMFGVSFVEWTTWKVKSPAFAKRIAEHQAGAAKSVERAMRSAATGAVVKRKVVTRYLSGMKGVDEDGNPYWHEFDREVQAERVVEEQTLPPSPEAGKLWMRASGREGFREVENKGNNYNVVVQIGASGTLSPEEEARISQFRGKRQMIDVVAAAPTVLDQIVAAATVVAEPAEEVAE